MSKGLQRSNGDPAGDGRQWAPFPQLKRQDRILLFQVLNEGSRWSFDFGMMLSCSVLIAGLGLLQDSTAVIIGAMLVAPLMTPLLGTGLGLVQGNFKLLGEAGRAMLFGSVAGLVLGIVLRLVTPGHEITPEVSLRGDPNILDLLIAFLAGVAAGYAVSRPKLSNALPGVAISVALVPPLAAAGIAFGSRAWLLGFGAIMLYVTNMVAIVLGSALVFRLYGIKAPGKQKHKVSSARRIVLALSVLLLLLVAPLGQKLLSKLREGQERPESITLSEDLWFDLHNRLDEIGGVDFVTGARASAKRPEDVTLVISADRPVSGQLLADLDRIIDEELGRDVKVKINVLQQGSVLEEKAMSDPETRVNE